MMSKGVKESGQSRKVDQESSPTPHIKGSSLDSPTLTVLHLFLVKLVPWSSLVNMLSEVIFMFNFFL